MKTGKILMCIVVLGLLSNVVWADALSDRKEAQNKLLAERAARVDAMRKLAERIKGLHITSETYVRDFVAESDTIETAMTAFLRGVRSKGKPKHYEDGSCEVTLEVTLNTVIMNLKQIHNRHYKGDKIKVRDFEKMTLTNKRTVISETGMGVPRPEFTADLDESVSIQSGTSYESPLNMSAASKAYWMAHVSARGRMMAVRAAHLDALRRLAERIKGVFITSETTVRDFVAESDQIDVSMNTFIRGARETRVRYHSAEPVVEVEMEVTLRDVYMTLKSWGQTHYRGDKIKMRRLEEVILKTRDKVIRETGMGIPPAKYMKGVTVAEQVVAAAVLNGPGWMSRKLRATGNAAVDTENDNVAQAKLMAYRAAELDARRKLAEQLAGLMITSNTSVRDFVAENDEIETSMLTFQQGARELMDKRKVFEDGSVETVVEIDLKPLWDVIIYWQRKLSITIN